MKTPFLLLVATAVCSTLAAETIEVTNFKTDGPHVQKTPLLVDSTDVQGKRYSAPDTLGSATFVVENTSYTNMKFDVKGVQLTRLDVDHNEVRGSAFLAPNRHFVELRFKGHPDSLKVSVSADGAINVCAPDDESHYYSIEDVLHARRYSYIDLSPTGKYLLLSTSQTLPGGRNVSETRLIALDTRRRTLGTSRWVAGGRVQWMPHEDRYTVVREAVGRRQLVAVDAATGAEEVLVDRLPDGEARLAPSGDWMLVVTRAEGPRENDGVYEVLQPEDRQAGWRSRVNIARYDIATGVTQPLTWGHHNAYASDISEDGRQILVMTSESRLTARPTTLNTLYLLDAGTLESRVLVKKDGFLESARFSPDGTHVLLAGSPECLNGVGKNLPEGRIPNSTDRQLYIMNLADLSLKPLTRDFNPSVSSYTWNRADGRIWFTAEDRDSVNLFVADPADGRITEVALPEEMVNRIDFASDAPVAVWYGNSASNSDRLYMLDCRRLSASLLDDQSARTLEKVTLGKCNAWTFTNSRGEELTCRYYLPPTFDAGVQYPMIVNFYGGCSPTSRNFESRYPQHAYAALGYVVLVINPSGATGFGQEFSSRHVNTAGNGVAEDIIEGTQRFCSEHPFVNAKKVGCIGASYGGFMTQYLLTRTDIFAAGISHAGISDHTSYWGEGYWGYSYSEVSMAGSYPWTHRDLYVDQSPLYNADKIHTPLLFLHGDGDTNVPVGESIQMFTALKLLGRPTAMVLVKGQNHWITEYDKRLRWQNTIFAWFARWLQDDDIWWKNMYPEKSL
jgi:dipeptidyl aminopeptidase/acylaminoacyl peptidase